MGAASSKVEEDKALQLCRERKKFVKQALEGRCSLAESHVAYIHSLKATGTALRKFVEPEGQIASSIYTSTSATPEPLALTEKSVSQFSFSSPSVSKHQVDATESTISQSPSPTITARFHADHMKFRGSSAKKVEERVSSPATGTVTFSSTPPNTTPRSADRPESSLSDGHDIPAGTPQWDYFGLFHPIDHQFSFQEDEGSNSNQEIDNVDDIRRFREEEGIPDLEDDDGENSSSNETQDSDNEFNGPSTDTLVQRFENMNRVSGQGIASPSPCNTVPRTGTVASDDEFLDGEGGSPPERSSLRDGSSAVTSLTDRKKKKMDRDDRAENIVEPKDFITSIRHIELLFVKASESGKDVLRMLEVNKLPSSLIFPAKESISLASVYLSACFSCGQGRRQVQEEPAQAAMKYLTWHNMASPSPSSSNQSELISNDHIDVMNGNLFNNYCMASGSHASTLDRLYAWERKLCDEVKASEIIRRDYDSKCKLLRQLELKAESSQKIDKTRANIKDLYSRFGVAIHRINSISKKIEELRDRELQPQLEELIDGMSRMWEAMFECHKLQYRVIAVAISTNTKFSVLSESWRQTALHLENELNYLSSIFTKWIGAQEFYLWAINNWLLKCVSLPQQPSKRKKRGQVPRLRDLGPPIYATCDVWLLKLQALPSKQVADSIRALAAETRKFLPRQERIEGKPEADNTIEAVEDLNSNFDRFRSSLVGLLGKLSEYSESSVDMYRELKAAIEEAKNNYRLKSRTQT